MFKIALFSSHIMHWPYENIVWNFPTIEDILSPSSLHPFLVHPRQKIKSLAGTFQGCAFSAESFRDSGVCSPMHVRKMRVIWLLSSTYTFLNEEQYSHLHQEVTARCHRRLHRSALHGLLMIYLSCNVRHFCGQSGKLAVLEDEKS